MLIWSRALTDCGLCPVVGPSGKVVVHGFGKFLERALVRPRLPALAAIERESIRTGAKWSQAKARIGAVFVSPPDNQVAASHDHTQATCGLACFQQSCQGRHYRRQPRNVWPSAGRAHVSTVPIIGWQFNQAHT